jgi:hypothetical protein
MKDIIFSKIIAVNLRSIEEVILLEEVRLQEKELM